MKLFSDKSLWVCEGLFSQALSQVRLVPPAEQYCVIVPHFGWTERENVTDGQNHANNNNIRPGGGGGESDGWGACVLP